MKFEIGDTVRIVDLGKVLSTEKFSEKYKYLRSTGKIIRFNTFPPINCCLIYLGFEKGNKGVSNYAGCPSGYGVWVYEQGLEVYTPSCTNRDIDTVAITKQMEKM